jgi:hypothetical protein
MGSKSLKINQAQKLRDQGDLARDRREWREAAQVYRQYLELDPDQGDIWVQFGHAVKEQGNLEEAEAAYRRAASLAPMDADSRLHLGHVLKRLGRPRQAAVVFGEVMRLAPTLDVIEELKTLGYGAQVQTLLEAVPGSATVSGKYLELKDFFQYLSHHATVTGITRVVLAVVSYLLEELDEADAGSYHFVHQLGDAEGLLLLPKQKLRRLVKIATSEVTDLASMVEIIGEMRQTSPLIRLKAGDLYFMPGAFWEFVDHPSWLLSMKRRGVYIGIYIYDLIPITHSYYCTAGLTDCFTAGLAETVRMCDFAFTISEFVAGQVRDFLATYQVRPFPVAPVLLAHELRLPTTKVPVPKVGSPRTAIDVLDDRTFVLCVCTLEARKNHIYLFYIWERMIAAGLDVPDLVFVGRDGWRTSDLLGQIESSRNLDGRLHLMHGLSDADLGTLYERCLFTVFPSFVEGWGLPVGESLSHSKVCVASSTSSIPEVGRDLVVYIDPFNLDSGYRAIRRLITEPAYLADLEAEIRKNFVPRTWMDVGRDLCSGMDGALSRLPPPGAANEVFAPRLGAGTLLDMNGVLEAGLRRTKYPENPVRFMFSQGWQGIEATGTWCNETSAELRFRADYETGREILILLLVGTSPWVDHTNALRVWTSGATGKRDDKESGSRYAQPIRPDMRFWIRVKAKVGAETIVTIQLQVDGPVVPRDPTAVPVAIRLHAIGYGATDDSVARISLLEEAMLLRS